MRLAGFVKGCPEPFGASKGMGQLCCSGKQWGGGRNLPDIFISLPPRCHASTAVSMPVQLFLCWYCRCQATTRVLEEDIGLLRR